MHKWLPEDIDAEYWMRPFTGMVMKPGGRHEHITETRLFFDFYQQLLEIGYSETQISDGTTAVRWEARPPLHESIALVEAVFRMAEANDLKPSAEFQPYHGHAHPRHIVDHFK